MGAGLTGSLCQDSQQLELRRRQADHPAVPPHLVTIEVDLQISYLHDSSRYVPGGMAKHHPQACREVGRAHRLHHVICGTRIQVPYDLFLVASSAEDDDGKI